MPDPIDIETLINGDIPDADEEVLYLEFFNGDGITGTVTHMNPLDVNYKDRVIEVLKEMKTLLASGNIE